MKYRVEIAEPAEADIEEAYLWIAQEAPEAAKRWRQGLYKVIDSLELLPFRYGRAPENDAVDYELRQHVYKRTYRIIYTVTEDRVGVLHVRHGARHLLLTWWSPFSLGIGAPWGILQNVIQLIKLANLPNPGDDTPNRQGESGDDSPLVELVGRVEKAGCEGPVRNLVSARYAC